ncbi:hypothetical protein ABEF95_004212 [Exophiala dermatitidis]
MAKKAAKASNSNKPAGQPPATPKTQVYTIPVKEFVPMAQYVAGFNKPPVKVPNAFVRALDRAIALRKRVGATMGGNEGERKTRSENDRNSDARHSFFVGVLEAVRETLKPRMSPDIKDQALPSQAVDAAAVDPQTQLDNLFSSLAVDEPLNLEEGMPESPAQSATPAPAGPEPTYKAETVTDLEEALFAFTCLLTDFDSIREVLEDTWIGYKERRVDIVSASITTNTALELARRLEEEQQHIFGPHGGSRHMLELYYRAHSLGQGQDADHKERPDDELKFAMYDFSSTFYWPVYLILGGYLDVHEPGSVPVYKPGTYGVYDLRADRSKMSNREKFKEDKVILCEILPDYSLISLRPRPSATDDEFTRGLCAALKSGNLLLSLVFAGQVFLDIHHILRENVGRGFDDLSFTCIACLESLNDNFSFHKNLKIANWPESNDRVLRQSASNIYASYAVDELQAVRRQDVQRMFAGDRPTSAEQYFRRFALAMGYSASNFAPDRRQNQAGPAASAAGPRGFVKQAPVSRMFMPRYSHGAERTDMTVEDVEKILDKSHWLEVVDSSDHP